MRLSFSYRLSDGLLLCQSLGSTGDIRCNLLPLSPRGFQLPTFCAGWCLSIVIFFLSPQEFQLPTFCAGWCSSAVIFLLSPRGLQLLIFRAGWCVSVVQNSGSCDCTSCWSLCLCHTITRPPSPQQSQVPISQAGKCSYTVSWPLSLPQSQLPISHTGKCSFVAAWHLSLPQSQLPISHAG